MLLGGANTKNISKKIGFCYFENYQLVLVRLLFAIYYPRDKLKWRGEALIGGAFNSHALDSFE